jgi:hypothetical protein
VGEADVLRVLECRFSFSFLVREPQSPALQAIMIPHYAVQFALHPVLLVLCTPRAAFMVDNFDFEHAFTQTHRRLLPGPQDVGFRLR